MSTFVFVCSVNVVGWHQSSCTLPHQLLVSGLLHKFASLQTHLCLYFILRLSGCYHYIKKEEELLGNWLMLIKILCLMCFPQLMSPDEKNHCNICMIPEPFFSRNLQLCWWKGFYCVCLSLFLHIISCRVLQNTFFLYKKEIQLEWWNSTQKIKNKHYRIKHEDQSSSCAAWCSATDSFF